MRGTKKNKRWNPQMMMRSDQRAMRLLYNIGLPGASRSTLRYTLTYSSFSRIIPGMSIEAIQHRGEAVRSPESILKAVDAVFSDTFDGIPITKEGEEALLQGGYEHVTQYTQRLDRICLRVRAVGIGINELLTGADPSLYEKRLRPETPWDWTVRKALINILAATNLYCDQAGCFLRGDDLWILGKPFAEINEIEMKKYASVPNDRLLHDVDQAMIEHMTFLMSVDQEQIDIRNAEKKYVWNESQKDTASADGAVYADESRDFMNDFDPSWAMAEQGWKQAKRVTFGSLDISCHHREHLRQIAEVMRRVRKT